jgi:hypothetical protein
MRIPEGATVRDVQVREFSVESCAGVHFGSHPSQFGCPQRHRGRNRARAVALRFAAATWIVACIVSAGVASAEDLAKTQMRSLDEQVQDIKSDVLTIAADLSALEEKLLYPSDTQVSVFVSLAPEEKAELDSVEIQIDGQPVARHIYSFKEVDALKKGGVQRIYTGNLPTGKHRLDVTVAGKLSGGRDFNGTETFDLQKQVGPKLVGIELAASEFGNASIRIGDQ